MEELSENKKLKAILLEEKPIFKKGKKVTLNIKGEPKKVIIKNIYSRRLEDLTWTDLEMVGYDNPNNFVKEWIQKNGSFDIDKKLWVVVYEEVGE